MSPVRRRPPASRRLMSIVMDQNTTASCICGKVS
ncbi:hypothetical protein SHIRM173S_07618 [Streptomyces hirsutus]